MVVVRWFGEIAAASSVGEMPSILRYTDSSSAVAAERVCVLDERSNKPKDPLQSVLKSMREW